MPYIPIVKTKGFTAAYGNEIYSIINSYRGLLSKFFGEHKKLY